MSAGRPLGAFAAYGIELEYMLVDAKTLSVAPVADQLLIDERGAQQNEVRRGAFGWSNELALHVAELKNVLPRPLEGLAAGFQAEVLAMESRLAPLDVRIMPGAAHPWMDPRVETRLWPHRDAAIYEAYDRIFDCRTHGWANLQSLHLNLPFSGDEEFARLHAAVRLALPILPSLAASSPFADGAPSGFMDYRMEAYRIHPARIPELIGRVIPETVSSREEYERAVLQPMYRAIEPLDPEGVLRHEWLNCRGAIARFDRSAIEIRVIDMQECPAADLAVAEATIAFVKALYCETWTRLADQQSISTEALAGILSDCIRDAERASIGNTQYLRLLGIEADRCEAGALWRHIAATALPPDPDGCLQLIVDEGPLARRLVRAVEQDCTRQKLHAVYGRLCECLRSGRQFRA